MCFGFEITFVDNFAEKGKHGKEKYKYHIRIQNGI
jgi:hemerythrin-like domain-containing protein